jgi:hypothetical protein
VNQDQFYYLLDDVIAAGGYHENENCRGSLTDLKERDANGRMRAVRTHACHKQFRVGIPYDAIEQKEGLPERHEGYAVVCAEGDMVAAWPRFQPEAM